MEGTDRTVPDLGKTLHSQLDGQGWEALDRMLCLESKRSELWMEALFSTGICLGLELGRLTPAR